MKKSKIVLFAAMALIVTLVALYFHYRHIRESTKEIRRFQSEFGFALPEDSKVIFSKNLSGWFGDGEILYVYQLSKTDMDTLTEKSRLAGWSTLPFDAEQVMIFKEKIGINDEEVSRYMPYGLPQGWGLIKDRRRGYEGQTMTTTSFMSYTNFTIGLIDPKTNRVYCYLYNS
jgi:hypothetical protein